MTSTRPIQLSRDETMLLSDRIHNDEHHGFIDEQQPVDIRTLLLKIGSVFLEVTLTSWDYQRTVPLAITEGEAWLFRSKVTTGDKTAGDSLFGVKLLRKIYAVLLEFDAAEIGPDASNEEGAIMTEDQKQALKQKLEGGK